MLLLRSGPPLEELLGQPIEESPMADGGSSVSAARAAAAAAAEGADGRNLMAMMGMLAAGGLPMGGEDADGAALMRSWAGVLSNPNASGGAAAAHAIAVLTGSGNPSEAELLDAANTLNVLAGVPGGQQQPGAALQLPLAQLLVQPLDALGGMPAAAAPPDAAEPAAAEEDFMKSLQGPPH